MDVVTNMLGTAQSAASAAHFRSTCWYEELLSDVELSRGREDITTGTIVRPVCPWAEN